jgi:hypothetical protein
VVTERDYQTATLLPVVGSVEREKKLQIGRESKAQIVKNARKEEIEE